MTKDKQVFVLPGTYPICQIDGRPINPASEPGHAIYLVKGYPMCALHRLLRRPVSNKLDYRKVFSQRAEEEKAELDKVAAKEFATKKENQRVMEVAADSQEAAFKINKKTQLNKT
jgi:hypothetical protein